MAIGAGIDLSRAPHRVGSELQLLAGVDLRTHRWLWDRDLVLSADLNYLPIAAGGQLLEPRIGLRLEHVDSVTAGPPVSYECGVGASMGVGGRISPGATVFVGASTFGELIELELSARAFVEPVIAVTLQLNVGRGFTRLLAAMSRDY